MKKTIDKLAVHVRLLKHDIFRRFCHRESQNETKERDVFWRSFQGCGVGVGVARSRRFWLESESEFKTAVESESESESEKNARPRLRKNYKNIGKSVV